MLLYGHIRTLNKDFVKEYGIISPYSGESSGIVIYLIKTWTSTIWELFCLIRKSEEIISTLVFENIRKKMDKEFRKNWDIIVNCALDKHTVKTTFAKSLSRIRSKITNHYDAGEISKGYKIKFKDDVPYLSKGNSMAQTRFYFADAAAEEYYISQTNKFGNEGEFADEVNMISDNLDRAIQSLVISYIKLRGHIRPTIPANKTEVL